MKLSAQVARAPWWGRWDLHVALTLRRRRGRQETTRRASIYLSLLPIVRHRVPIHGRRWRWGWIFGLRRVPGGSRYLHMGPLGVSW